MKNYEIKIIDKCESTNDLLLEEINNGIGEGYSILSFYQSKGRGRNKKKWVSRSGNIFLSTLVEPKKSKKYWYQLSLLVGYSLIEALIDIGLSSNDLRMKWPNDILLNYKKVCGILIESIDNFVVIGVGLNVTSHPNKLKSYYEATHLGMKKNLIINDLKQITECVLDRIYFNYTTWTNFSFIYFYKKINTKLAFLNKNVFFKLNEYNNFGKIIGVNSQGHLKILIKNKVIKILPSDTFVCMHEKKNVPCN